MSHTTRSGNEFQYWLGMCNPSRARAWLTLNSPKTCQDADTGPICGLPMREKPAALPRLTQQRHPPASRLCSLPGICRTPQSQSAQTLVRSWGPLTAELDHPVLGWLALATLRPSERSFNAMKRMTSALRFDTLSNQELQTSQAETRTARAQGGILNSDPVAEIRGVGT